MNEIILKRNNILKKILPIFIAFSIILPSVVVQALYQEENIENSYGLEKDIQDSYPLGWRQLTSDGFGKETNLATRGIAIYKDELYIGTQNVILPKLFQNIFPKLYRKISQLLPNKIPEFLQRNHLFKIIYQKIHSLRRSTVRTALHLAVRASQGCEIWKYNYTTDSLMQIVGSNSITGMKSGFNYSFNCVASVMRVFEGDLYVGTWSTPLGSLNDPNRKGAEIWRYDGTTWEQVVGHMAPFMKGGFNNPDNVAVWSMEEYKGYLYVGTMNWDLSKNGGSEIWRTADGVHWEQVIKSGFKPFMSTIDLVAGVINTYVWSMEVFQNQLYVGTFNLRYRLISNVGMGCQLWRTNNGKNWRKVKLPTKFIGLYKDGFGESENYGIRRMVVYDNELYIGTATNIIHDKGCEIWKYNGKSWTPLISKNVPGTEPNDIEYAGFGNPLNKYVWSMVVSSDNKLWVGTANGKFVNLIEPETEGCEIWCYNGTEWTPIVKDGNDETPNGFGNRKNEGARSMIEYPHGTGNIIVGTFKLVSTRFLIPQEGCELWIRIKKTENS